jgi:peptide/nickel transport system substrate-binding protein
LNKTLKPYNRDLNKSRELLKKSGFYWQKGRLFDKNGHRVEFDLLTNAGNTEREAIGVMVKQDLEDLGMKVNFKPIEFNSLVNKLVSTPDWDMVIMGLTGSPIEPNRSAKMFGCLRALCICLTNVNRANTILQNSLLKSDSTI